MKNDEINEDLDYKKLYFELKEKYEKLKNENEELKTDNKIKDVEILKLRKNSKDDFMKLNLNSLEKKDISTIKYEDNNSIYKNNSKKYETYSCDSFRNEVEHNNDLINDLIKIDIMKIEKVMNFQIISNKKNNIKSIIFDIDEILLNIKKKQESLHQIQKMLNIKNDS